MEGDSCQAATVYVLRSTSSGYLYIGHTLDLHRRLAEHNRGDSRWTRNRGPWELVYCEIFLTRGEAMARERQLKSGQGRDWLRGLIHRGNPDIAPR